MDLGMETRFLKIKAQIKLKRGWRLNPPISQKDVDALENAYGFVLPEEYKKFITQIGNGGRIPCSMTMIPAVLFLLRICLL